MIDKTPIFIDLDRRREIVFNLNTEILIRNNGGQGASVLETVGTRLNPETGEEEKILNVNPENLRLYLWAGLQDDARREGEKLTQEDIGKFFKNKRTLIDATAKVLLAVSRYYGDGQGEAPAPSGR